MITKEYLQQELAKRIDGYKRGVEATTDDIIAEMKSILVLVDALQDRVKDYDEALEKARKYHAAAKSINDPSAARYENIFPELRESEDENIRKWIVEELEITRDAMSGKNDYSDDPDIIARLKRLDEALSWLEKQKEQKPILEVFGFKVGDAVRLKDGDGRKHIIKSFEEIEGVHGPNFYHVEFEDNSARDGIYPGEEYPNGYYTQMEKFEEEPKPELYDMGRWDEESYNNGIHHVLQNPEIYGLTKQKPAWSEEDEKIMQTMIKEGDLKPSEIAWLKSLRPGWKPTEEQMEALNKARRFIPYNCDILESLYEQLKQL